MDLSLEHAPPSEPRPRRWYRLHGSTWVAAIAVASVLVTLNFSGYIRIGGKDFSKFEWQNGWPCVYLQRNIEFTPPAYDRDDPSPTKVVRFRPVALVGDVALALAAVVGSAWVAERRRRRCPGHPFQYRLSGLLAIVFLIAAALGWELFQQRLQKQAADQLLPGSFGYLVDQGTPNWLRRHLPGGQLRPFDRITLVELLGPECMGKRLAPLSRLRRVKQIKFMTNELDDEGLSHVRGLTDLVWLDASYCRVTDRGLAHLAALTRMQSLSISNKGITGAGLVHLGRMRRLEVLHLGGTSLTDDGSVWLRGLSSLKQLELSNSAAVGDGALIHVAALEKLEILMIAGTNVSDSGLASLRGLKHLKLLDLRNTRVTALGVIDFQRAVPNCRFVR